MRRLTTTSRSPHLFPHTVLDFLAELDRRFPEPRPSPTDDPRVIEWQLAQRSVCLTMQDAYDAKHRKDSHDVPDL